MMNFKGFGRNQSDLIVIRNVLGLNYKNQESFIIGLGSANVIRSPVIYGFAETSARNSAILYQENCIKIIRMLFIAQLWV